MKKRAYITPAISEMAGEPESLMLTVSAANEGIYGDDTPDSETGDNRSRLFDAWGDDDLDEEF